MYICHQCASELYGLGPDEEGEDSNEEEEDEDIEASIEREISSLKEKKPKKLFLNIKLDLQCG